MARQMMNGAGSKNATALTIVVSASTLPAHAEDKVPRFVLDQALAFANRGATVHLLAPHAPASRRKVWPQQESAGVTQWRFRYAPRRWEVLTDHGIMPALAKQPWLALLIPALMTAQFFALWRLVRRVHPDIIYAHWFTPQALTACLVARLTETPFGFTTHASDVAVWRCFGIVGRFIVRLVSARAAFITAVSTQTAEKLFQFFDPAGQLSLRKRLQIIPMGVDITNRPISPGNSRHAIIVVRLVEKKGLEVLLNAWPTVIAALPDARLTIGGSGPLEDRLRNIVRKRGLAVDMPGFVTGHAKTALLASAGVVVQPSVETSNGDSDGLPVALLEGISMGCIPIASDISGAQDIIESGRNGYIVPAGNAAALAQAIISAMTLSVDERRMMLECGKALCSRLSWPQIARDHLSVIEEAARAPHNRGLRSLGARIVKTAFFIVVAAAFGWFLSTVDWAALQDIRFAPRLLILASLLALTYRYYGVVVWRIVLTQLGSHSLPKFCVLADVYAKAWLARYVPGTIPWIAGKVLLAAEQGIPKSRLAISSIIEAGAQVVGVGVLSLGLLALDGRVAEVAPFFGVLAITGALALTIAMAPPVFNRLIALGMRLLKRDAKLEVTWSGAGAPVALYALGATISGISYVVFSHAVISTLNWSDTLFLIGAFGLAGVIGMLTPLVPSGLGTRDGAQLLLLLTAMPPLEASVIVIASRLWSALIDIIFWAGASATRRIRTP